MVEYILILAHLVYCSLWSCCLPTSYSPSSLESKQTQYKPCPHSIYRKQFLFLPGPELTSIAPVFGRIDAGSSTSCDVIYALNWTLSRWRQLDKQAPPCKPIPHRVTPHITCILTSGLCQGLDPHVRSSERCGSQPHRQTGSCGDINVGRKRLGSGICTTCPHVISSHFVARSARILICLEDFPIVYPQLDAKNPRQICAGKKTSTNPTTGLLESFPYQEIVSARTRYALEASRCIPLDGMFHSGKVIVFITTNDKGSLPPLMLRSGRVDVGVDFHYCDEDMVSRLLWPYLEPQQVKQIASNLAQRNMTPADVLLIVDRGRRSWDGILEKVQGLTESRGIQEI